MRERIVDYLIGKAKRTPYFHLDGYMERYWLIPYKDPKAGHGCGPVSFWKRPIAWLFQQFGIAVRVHHILRSDDVRAFHDHPWWYITWIMRGAYEEVVPVFHSNVFNGVRSHWWGTGSLRFSRAESWHRLEVPDGLTAWTLFITGPYQNSWGFLTQPAFKTPWREYHKKYIDPERN